MPLTTVDAGLLNSQSQQTWRNRIINGAMMIDQRNAGASVSNPVGAAYVVDRFVIQGNTGASKFTAQQNAGSVTPPAGFTNYLGLTSSSAYTPGAAEFYMCQQWVEGLNIADLGWGTANAQAVTVSFWVRSSLTGTFAGSLNNADYTRSYPFTFSIGSANTWTQITKTITGDTSGTWLTTNGRGIGLHFNMGAGSSMQGTANAWNAGFYISTAGAVNVVSTSGATLYITGVQLEKGSTATSFDYRPYGTELQLCQRYYFVLGGASGSLYTTFCTMQAYSSSAANSGVVIFPVAMRAIPTFSYGGALSNYLVQNASGTGATPGSITLNSNETQPTIANVRVGGTSGLVAGNVTALYANNNNQAQLQFSAEL